jgi:hypothetical protein
MAYTGSVSYNFNNNTGFGIKTEFLDNYQLQSRVMISTSNFTGLTVPINYVRYNLADPMQTANPIYTYAYKDSNNNYTTYILWKENIYASYNRVFIDTWNGSSFTTGSIKLNANSAALGVNTTNPFYFNDFMGDIYGTFKVYGTIAYYGTNTLYGITQINMTTQTYFNNPSIRFSSGYITDFVLYNNYLYASVYTGTSGKIVRYKSDCTAVTDFYTGTSSFYGGIHAYNGNLYVMQTAPNGNLQVLILALPTVPANITSFDLGNTVSVSSGNLKVSLVDNANKASNNVYYYYSFDNVSFTNSNVKSNGPTSPNYFYVNVSTISNTLYVYAYNDEGVSNTISTSVTVYQTPRPPSSYTVSSSSSGNINVTVTETSPPSNYNLNGVTYWYYVYTTGTNQSANVAAYSQGGGMDSSYTTNFVIQNLSANNSRVYLLAKNSVGNSSPFLSTNANVSVFTTPVSPNSYSLSFDELNGITVSITDTSNVAINQVYYHYYYYRVGDIAPNQSADINVYANSYVPVVNGQTAYSFNIKGLQTSYYNIYIATKNTVGATIYSPIIAPVNVICFKEDSRILTNRGYRKIQYLKKGDLIKTFQHGFKPIYKIGKKDIIHVPSTTERGKDRLYKCSPTEYPEVFEDLVLTGCHSILVDEFADDEQRNQTKEINGGIYVTDKKYRLPVCVDRRASVYEHAGKYAVFHVALENDDNYMNYGIYANGLLVESTSKRFLDEYQVMETVRTPDRRRRVGVRGIYGVRNERSKLSTEPHKYIANNRDI